MGGSSSQPSMDPVMSLINAYSIRELYSPRFLDSFQDNTSYWHEPIPHESPVDQVATSPTKNKKKPSSNRQKRTIQSDDTPRKTSWTTEEEIALAKGWLTVLEKARMSEGSKRHKLSGSNSFNQKSGEASVNLNTNVGDNDEDEVQEVRRPKGRDKTIVAGKKGLELKNIDDNHLNEANMVVDVENNLVDTEIQEVDGLIVDIDEEENLVATTANNDYNGSNGAMKLAIEEVLIESKHRICMWHIMQKIPAKEIIKAVWACQILECKTKEGCEIVKVRDKRAYAYRTLNTEKEKEVVQQKEYVAEYKSSCPSNPKYVEKLARLVIVAAAEQGTTTAAATEQAMTTATAAEQGATTAVATEEATTTAIVSEEANNAF
nr:hypothetical protein [Tanacetum cinerariifolium]